MAYIDDKNCLQNATQEIVVLDRKYTADFFLAKVRNGPLFSVRAISQGLSK